MKTLFHNLFLTLLSALAIVTLSRWFHPAAFSANAGYGLIVLVAFTGLVALCTHEN